MNENIDLTKILKNCPKETKLYSILHGEVKYVGINDKSLYKVEFKSEDGEIFGVTLDGRHLSYFNGECILLPSKDQRDWSKFIAPWYKKEKFDPKTLKAFDKVLAFFDNIWFCDFFSHINESNAPKICGCMGTGNRSRVIPYNDDTKHLVGTKEEAPDFYRYWEE